MPNTITSQYSTLNINPRLYSNFQTVSIVLGSMNNVISPLLIGFSNKINGVDINPANAVPQGSTAYLISLTLQNTYLQLAIYPEMNSNDPINSLIVFLRVDTGCFLNLFL